MLGLIISDTHNNLVNLEKVLRNYGASVDFLIHCGDVNDVETIDYLVKNFKKDIYLVWGNTDTELSNKNWAEVYREEFNRLHFFLEIGKFKINNYQVAITHYPELAKSVQMENDYTFYGHSHQPDLQEVNNKNWLINPGNVAGLYQRASFALWHIDKNIFELKLLENLK